MRVIDASVRERMARDIAACRALLRENSKTFFVASLLLPAAVRAPASALYAFCRVADDAVDLDAVGTRASRHAAVDRLSERLERLYAGRPIDAAPDRAFADVVDTYAIPRAVPDALLEGFRWDADERRYETLDELTDYAARVAGTVGVMMSLLMHTRDAYALARASDLGVAMQLSNIARDIGEDARAGRLYLPMAWLRETGVDVEAFLHAPRHSPALSRAVHRLVDTADALYARVGAGVAVLPRGCQPGINAARFLYAEIGHEVVRIGAIAINTRAIVPASVKAKLLARAVVTGGAAVPAPQPPLEACRFLVDACEASTPPADLAPAEPEWWNIEARIAWLIDFLERMERRDREAAALHSRAVAMARSE
jgi:phytoene synthase